MSNITPEDEHEFTLQPSATARQIARSGLAVAHSDITNAFRQLMSGSTDEALQMIAEAREQLEFAQNALSGRLWSLTI